MIILNQNQIERLYNIFDFEDYETIETATIESDRGGVMEICYRNDLEGYVGCYKPYFAKHSQEDSDKLKFILG